MIFVNIYLDTSVLMHSTTRLEKLIGEGNKLVVCTLVLEELDNHKDGKDGEKAFKARTAIKFLKKYENQIEFITSDGCQAETIKRYELDPNKPDNKILEAAIIYEIETGEKLEIYTNDISMSIKARRLGLECLAPEYEEDKSYKGYIEIKGTEEENDYTLKELMVSDTLHPNQYIIVTDTDYEENGEIFERSYAVKWTGDDYAETIIPRSKELQPKNMPQACAIDLMFSKDIPIKIICGGYGSGKTYIAVKSAEELINRYFCYSKLLLVRNPIPADNIDIGALPGTKHDKVGSYFQSMTQYLSDVSSNMYEDSFDPDNLEAAKRRGYQLEMEIPSFMKGRSVDDTLMIVDECEDLNLKLIKLLGTRIGNNSAIVLTGDWHQAEQQYKYDSGISKLIEQTIDDPLVGIVVLDEDVRSSVSKTFANLK
jgi:PhoH-like ATPase